jgi:hypothetical protein
VAGPGVCLQILSSCTTWVSGAALQTLLQVRVTGQQQHLMALGSLGEHLRDRGRAPGIEVHQHIVENDREGLGALGKGLCESESQTEVELFDAATAQVGGVHLGSGGGHDPDGFAASFVGDRRQQARVTALGHLCEALTRTSQHGGLMLLLMAFQGALEQQPGTSEDGPGLEHSVELLLESESCLLQLGYSG